MNKILVIEDEINIQHTISDILKLNDYDVVCTSNGKLGLIKAQTYKPDLVLCDVMMPELNGWETLVKFRATEGLYQIPFIFLSSLSENDDLRKGMELGAEDYLFKPFEPLDLLSAINKQIDKRRALKNIFFDEFKTKVKSQKK